MKKCNCWLGILNSYEQTDENDLRLETIVEDLTEKSEYSTAFDSSKQFRTFKPQDFIDRRRGLATLFIYCPLCGLKISWSTIRKELS
jgi:hypothetical protein